MTRLDIKAPADLLDLADLGGAMTRVQWGILRHMWASGPTWALSADGRRLAVCGLYPVDDAGYEAWFNFSADARPHLLAIARAVRLTLSAAHYGEIVACCRSKAGVRFARAAGFSFQAPVAARPEWEWWRWKP